MKINLILLILLFSCSVAGANTPQDLIDKANKQRYQEYQLQKFEKAAEESAKRTDVSTSTPGDSMVRVAE